MSERRFGPNFGTQPRPLGHGLRPRCFEDQPVALVGLCRKRWRIGESVGASLVAPSGLAPVRRGRGRRGLLREAPARLCREQTNVGCDGGHDSRNGLCCPATHKSHSGVAVSLVAGRLHTVVARLNGVSAVVLLQRESLRRISRTTGLTASESGAMQPPTRSSRSKNRPRIRP